jgi:hypothetical protein
MSSQSQPGEEGGKPDGDPHTFTQDVQYSGASARVPEKVGRGVFSTGVLVLEGASEFALDFLQRMSQPYQVVARVIIPTSFLPRLIGGVRENLDNWRKAYGPLPVPPPTPPPATPPTAAEVYGSLKLPDEVVAGVYANSAYVSNSQAAFCFDFIASFYPRAIVTARVFLGTAQVTPVLTSLVQAWQTHEAKLQRPPQTGPSERLGTGPAL